VDASSPAEQTGHVLTTPVGVSIVAVTLVLVVLTGVGARRRGLAVGPAVVAVILFPITWTVWYVRDEQLWRSSPVS
jgi:hypothetical protein